jgi:hypothetical protein
MTTPDLNGDGLAAALIQISAHAERISGIDSREAAHFEDVAARLRELADQLATISGQASENSTILTRHDAILANLDGLDTQVASLAAHLTHLAEDDDGDDDSQNYRPVPAPKWWKLTDHERDVAMDRLRAWVEQVYRPGYGRLAATLPPCWEHHPACLYILDWLSELWSVLYVPAQRDARTLAAQAEWHTRLLPAAADHIATEATGCRHT